jgi:transcriptional regulator with XRE-family HTH domain
MEDNSKLRVKEICKERGWSLKQLAAKMGVAPETLTRAISDNANPTLATLKNIANALEIEIGELFASSNTANQISGHIEVNGEVFSIKSFSDFKRLYNKLRTVVI